MPRRIIVFIVASLAVAAAGGYAACVGVETPDGEVESLVLDTPPAPEAPVPMPPIDMEDLPRAELPGVDLGLPAPPGLDDGVELPPDEAASPGFELPGVDVPLDRPNVPAEETAVCGETTCEVGERCCDNLARCVPAECEDCCAAMGEGIPPDRRMTPEPDPGG